MRTTRWTTRISDTSEDAIRIRGYDLADLIERLSFGEMFYLLMRGELPSVGAGRMVDAMLVACADHGIITTSVSARYAVASGTPLQGALAAGVLMIGDVYGGAVEQAARFYAEALGEGRAPDPGAVVAAASAAGEKLPGFGHPLHGGGDPRSRALIDLAHEYGVAGDAVAFVTGISAALKASGRKRIPLNADGALAAIALDLGFDWRTTRSFMLLSRSAGILAHASEELLEGRPWRFPPPAEHAVKTHEDYYTGVAPRSFDRPTQGGRADA